MSQAPNLDELSDLYTEIFVRQLVELTKAPGIIWSAISPLSFKSTLVDENENFFEFFITKGQTATSDRSYSYNLDVIKNGEKFASIAESETATTERSTNVSNLFSEIERIATGKDDNIKEINKLVMGVSKCY